MREDEYEMVEETRRIIYNSARNRDYSSFEVKENPVLPKKKKKEKKERVSKSMSLFDFQEKHYTKEKWSVDVDVLIDDSPEKLDIFNDRSVAYGRPICMKQTWNQESQKKYMTIDRLSDITTRLFG